MSSKKGSISASDAANSFIRSLLSEISHSLGEWGKDEQKKTLDYFEYKCPYTGEDIREAYEKGECDLDHIIGHNKDKCGLHIFGNLVWTTKTTNGKKSKFDAKDNPEENDSQEDKPKESYERFIRSLDISKDLKDANIEKLRIFREEYTDYASIHKKYYPQIQKFAQKKYDEIVNMTTKSAKKLAKKLKVPYMPPNTKNDISETERQSRNKFWDWAKYKESTQKDYGAALNQILEDAHKNFDDFISIIDDKTIKDYQPGGKKAALGGRNGLRVLKRLLEYKTEKSVTEKKGITSLIKNKLNGIRTFVLGIVRQKRV